jgi:hypothetical protein
MSIGNIDWSGLAAGKGLVRGMSVGSQLAQNMRNAELQKANIGMAERKEQRGIEAAQAGAQQLKAQQQAESVIYDANYLLKNFTDADGKFDETGAKSWIQNSRIPAIMADPNRGDPSDSQALLQKTGPDFINELKYVAGQGGGAGARKIKSTNIDPQTGIATLIYEDGEVESIPVEALQGRGEQELDLRKQLANLEVDTEGRKAAAKFRQKRISDTSQEYANSVKLANQTILKANEAGILIEKSSQGLGGVGKLKLASIFPNIDVSDEAALDSALTDLALTGLQVIKGPTTDFEFGVVEDRTGRLGLGKSANKAKINALKRSQWFVKEQARQYKDYIKRNGDVDMFEFNFNAPAYKGSNYSLTDLQETAASNNLTIEETIKKFRELEKGR